MEIAGRLSVSGTQCGVPAVSFVVFQMPPLTDPTYMMFGSVGCTAMACMAPLIWLLGRKDSCPLIPGAVPSLAQKLAELADMVIFVTNSSGVPLFVWPLATIPVRSIASPGA